MAKTEKLTMNLQVTPEVKKFVKIQSANNDLYMFEYVSKLLTNEFKKSLKK